MTCPCRNGRIVSVFGVAWRALRLRNDQPFDRHAGFVRSELPRARPTRVVPVDAATRSGGPPAPGLTTDEALIRTWQTSHAETAATRPINGRPRDGERVAPGPRVSGCQLINRHGRTRPQQRRRHAPIEIHASAGEGLRLASPGHSRYRPAARASGVRRRLRQSPRTAREPPGRPQSVGPRAPHRGRCRPPDPESRPGRSGRDRPRLAA